MNVTDLLKQAGGLDAMARDLGVSPDVAQQGAAALLPSILSGFQQKTGGQDGGAGLGGLIGQLGGGALLDSVIGADATPVSQGNNILGEIFGSKDVSRNVAADAASQTGLSGDLLKKMLPILSMLVAGYLARQGAAKGTGMGGGGLGDLLGGMLGGSGGTAGGLGGGLGKMLDRDGDGNPLNDIIGMASKFRK